MNLIRPDGTQPAPMGFTGNNVINVPWGVSIDGNDDVWVGNFWGRGVVLMVGAEPQGHPAGTKPGDAIHQFQSGKGVLGLRAENRISPRLAHRTETRKLEIKAGKLSSPCRASSVVGRPPLLLRRIQGGALP